MSTSLALAWVAAGRCAAYVTDSDDLSGSVHFAAGIALCRAAGCVVTGGVDRGREPGAWTGGVNREREPGAWIEASTGA